MHRCLEEDSLLADLSELLRTRPDGLSRTVEKILGDLKDAQKQVEQLQLKLARSESGAATQVREVKGVRVLSQRVENLDRNALRTLADQLKNKLESGVVVLGAPTDGKVSLVVMVTADLTDRIKADQLIRKIAPLVGGGGGGRPDMAEAGGRDLSKLDEALEQTYQAVADLLP